MRKAIIIDGVVANVTIGGDGIDLSDNSPVGIGWTYDGSEFVAPAVEAVAPPLALSRDLTKLAFRRLFTPLEQKAIDRFNATFETHPVLTDEQKDDVRTGLENYRAASSVSLDDPDTVAVLALYEALGILEAGRAAEILA